MVPYLEKYRFQIALSKGKAAMLASESLPRSMLSLRIVLAHLRLALRGYIFLAQSELRMLQGRCRNGEQCRFAHGNAELRTGLQLETGSRGAF